MARKRTLAPGFFLNEDLAECSPLARLLFAGMWCWADREGRLEDRPRKLKAEILPYDSADGEALVAELANRGFVQRYEVDGVRVIQVVEFSKYQDPHPKETQSILPACAGVHPGSIQGEPKADLGQTKIPPRSPRPSCPSRPSQPSRPARSLDGGRASSVRLAPDTADLMAAVAAGLGRAVAPFTTQDDADEFERRIHSFAQGPPEARAYLAATCRRRSTQPETAKLLLLWLRDLDPKPETAA